MSNVKDTENNSDSNSNNVLGEPKKKGKVNCFVFVIVLFNYF